MKPLVSQTQDDAALVELGRASVQVVHDLKNQINGLKLYATFLRKRLEKAERPADELETVAKLLAGLERVATDTAALVRYGRPLELRRAPNANLARILAAAADGAPVQIDEGSYTGEFDTLALTEALKNITSGAYPAATQTTANTASTATTTAATDSSGAGATSAVGSVAAGGVEYGIRLRREQDAADAPFAVVEWSGVTRANNGDDPFRSFAGTNGLRMALAAKIIKAHGGEAVQEAERVRVRLPLSG
ncbi:MAG TPA: hypothetical protein VF666_12980 [Pyrinomonadaceae bacterium]|jgi:hypothetical protein